MHRKTVDVQTTASVGHWELKKKTIQETPLVVPEFLSVWSNQQSHPLIVKMTHTSSSKVFTDDGPKKKKKKPEDGLQQQRTTLCATPDSQ